MSYKYNDSNNVPIQHATKFWYSDQIYQVGT